VYLIQLLLPTRSPDGATLNDAVKLTRDELVQRFGGITAYLQSPAAGAWTADGGDVEQDAVVLVEVVADAFDRAWWRSFASRLKQRFDQQAMHVRASRIEMLE
jgi:hypothetical protein